MALSNEEQRLLEQMEAALAAEDPKLAHALRGSATRKLHRRRAVLAGLGFIVGIVALVAGMEIHPLVSILGFVVMLAATVAAITAWQHVGHEGAKANPSGHRSAAIDSAILDKFEERWKNRHDDGA